MSRKPVRFRFSDACEGEDASGKEREFSAGEVAELRPDSAERWERRGKGAPVDPGTPLGKPEPSAEDGDDDDKGGPDEAEDGDDKGKGKGKGKGAGKGGSK